MTVKQARKYLPKKLRNLSDEEVESLIGQLEVLAEIFIETFDSSGSKKQLGVIDSNKRTYENRN